MNSRACCVSATSLLFQIAAAAVLLWGMKPARAQTIDIQDFFVLAPNSAWTLTGNASANDYLYWNVLPAKRDISATTHAFQIATRFYAEAIYADPDVHQTDYWFPHPDGRLLFYGKYETSGGEGLGFMAQEILAHQPLNFGGKGQHLGDTVSSTASTTITLNRIGIGLPPITENARIDSTIKFKEFMPDIQTPAGVFRNVLHLNVEVYLYPSQITSQGSYTLLAGDFYFARGIGLVKYTASNYPLHNDLLVSGLFNGNPITGFLSAKDWMLYQ